MCVVDLVPAVGVLPFHREVARATVGVAEHESGTCGLSTDLLSGLEERLSGKCHHGDLAEPERTHAAIPGCALRTVADPFQPDLEQCGLTRICGGKSAGPGRRIGGHLFGVRAVEPEGDGGRCA